MPLPLLPAPVRQLPPPQQHAHHPPHPQQPVMTLGQMQAHLGPHAAAVQQYQQQNQQHQQLPAQQHLQQHPQQHPQHLQPHGYHTAPSHTGAATYLPQHSQPLQPSQPYFSQSQADPYYGTEAPYGGYAVTTGPHPPAPLQRRPPNAASRWAAVLGMGGPGPAAAASRAEDARIGAYQDFVGVTALGRPVPRSAAGYGVGSGYGGVFPGPGFTGQYS